MEIWRDVVGYEGAYQVSNLGRIKSLPKLRRKSEKILKPLKQTYSFVDLGDGKSIKKFLVHRLVCEAFLENREGKEQVNHINGDKHDNRLSNLEWATRSENQKHAIKSGLRSTKGTKNSQSKLSEEIVLEIRSSDLRTSELSKLYNISQPTICDIRKLRSWTHI